MQPSVPLLLFLHLWPFVRRCRSGSSCSYRTYSKGRLFLLVHVGSVLSDREFLSQALRFAVHASPLPPKNPNSLCPDAPLIDSSRWDVSMSLIVSPQFRWSDLHVPPAGMGLAAARSSASASCTKMIKMERFMSLSILKGVRHQCFLSES